MKLNHDIRICNVIISNEIIFCRLIMTLVYLETSRKCNVLFDLGSRFFCRGSLYRPVFLLGNNQNNFATLNKYFI